MQIIFYQVIDQNQNLDQIQIQEILVSLNRNRLTKPKFVDILER